MTQTSPGLSTGSHYQSIFDRALESYEKKTGKDLTSIPLFRKFESCSSPGDVITLLREQFSMLDRSRSGSDSEKLTNWLNPTVNAVNAFSGTIGGSVGLVRLTLFEFDSSRIWTLMLFSGIPTRGSNLHGHWSPSLGELEDFPPLSLVILCMATLIEFFSRVIATFQIY
jgi:hypothetical protein